MRPLRNDRRTPLRPQRRASRRRRDDGFARGILDRVPVGIAVSDERTGRFIFVNPAFARSLGYDPVELVGYRPRDLHPPSVVPAIAEAFVRTTAGEPPIGPIPVLRKDGSVILALVSVFRGELAGRRCAIGVFDDVTERVHTERLDLARADILTALAGGEGEGDVLDRVIRFAQEGIANASATIVPGADDEAAPPSAWREPIRGPGGESWGLLQVIPATPRDPTASESRHLASAAAFAALAMERSRAIAERIEQSAVEAAIHARSTFLTHVGHEIRTPLNAVIGFAELLHDEPALGERQRERLRMITRSGEHLLRLVTDLLDAGRVDAGATIVRSEPFSLQAAFDEVAALFRAPAEAKGLSFTYRADLPDRAVGDGHVLRRVLINLLGNAVKFTSHGGVLLWAEWRAGWLRVEVEDSGPGIAAADRDHVFDPYFLGAAGLSMGGTGLGLPLSRRMVASMGGALTLLDAQEGTRFRVDLPLAAPSEAGAETVGFAASAHPVPSAPPAVSPHPGRHVVASTIRAILAAAVIADVAALELFDAHRDDLRAAFGAAPVDALAHHLAAFDFPAAAAALRDLTDRA